MANVYYQQTWEAVKTAWWKGAYWAKSLSEKLPAQSERARQQALTWGTMAANVTTVYYGRAAQTLAAGVEDILGVDVVVMLGPLVTFILLLNLLYIITIALAGRNSLPRGR